MSKNCSLCGASKKLSKSHIIPEFMHKQVYDQEGKALYTTYEGETRHVTEGMVQHLLCDKCESKLSHLETYGSQVIKTIKKNAVTPGSIHIERGVDYKNF